MADASESSSPLETAELVADCRNAAPDSEAALYARYVERLTALIQKRISRRLSARMEADDVITSAYRSLFLGLRKGRFTFEKSGDLWRLLVEISLHKLNRQIDRQQAARRSVEREQPFASSDTFDSPLSHDPSPEAAAEVEETLQQMLAALDPLGCSIIERRLQGYLVDEIAGELGCSERTVRRHMQRARDLLIPGSESVNRKYHQPARPDVTSLAIPSTRSRRREHIPDAKLPIIDFANLTLLKQIGEGGIGKVYLAAHRPDDRRVAVKFLKKAYWQRGAIIDRFLCEARLLSELRHPNIVELRGLGRTPGGAWFLVMNYIDGADLSAVLSQGPVDVQQAATWMRAIASATAYSHGRGIVHCDLKPSNVLIDRFGRALVTDFGLAIQPSENQMRQHVAGTPAFMAPEQIDSKWGAVDTRTDVWGLGAVLHALLTGRPPIKSERVSEAIETLVRDQELPPPVGTETRPLPAELIELCRSCLRKRPEQRPASAEVVAGALAQFLQRAR